MKNGFLKKYFKGIVAKKLSAVETMPRKSNQHEFNAYRGMRTLFGDDDRKFKTMFMYLDDDETITAEDYLTWYDARRNHPTRTEYRLYYPSTQVSKLASEGDTLFICVKQDNTILCVVSKKDSTITNQLYWLFDIDQRDTDRFVENSELNTDGNQLEHTVKTILNQIGIEYEYSYDYDDEYHIRCLIMKFGMKFPKTSIFSEYARSLVPYAEPQTEPDKTLMRWYDQEEKLFYLMEQQIIEEKLKQGFYTDGKVDTDDFIKFSLSVQNRRKARAGLSLENHVSAIFNANGIRYSHTPMTENRSRPDFLLPDINVYHDIDYPSDKLTVLGSKSTCKDRWRQVLAEADRIKRKHLITLEAAISTYQTDEMIRKNLQLIVPKSIHSTYTINQQKWLFTIKDFIKEVREKQNFYENFIK